MNETCSPWATLLRVDMCGILGAPPKERYPASTRLRRTCADPLGELDQESPKFSDGGSTVGDHEIPTEMPVYLAPATADELNTVRLALVPVACWRVNHVLFDFDSSMVRPEIRDELVNLADLIDARPDAPVSVFGHANPVGDDSSTRSSAVAAPPQSSACTTETPISGSGSTPSPRRRPLGHTVESESCSPTCTTRRTRRSTSVPSTARRPPDEQGGQIVSGRERPAADRDGGRGDAQEALSRVHRTRFVSALIGSCSWTRRPSSATMACRFYDRLARRSPCEGITRVTVRVRLFDRQSVPMPFRGRGEVRRVALREEEHGIELAAALQTALLAFVGALCGGRRGTRARRCHSGAACRRRARRTTDILWRIRPSGVRFRATVGQKTIDGNADAKGFATLESVIAPSKCELGWSPVHFDPSRDPSSCCPDRAPPSPWRSGLVARRSTRAHRRGRSQMSAARNLNHSSHASWRLEERGSERLSCSHASSACHPKRQTPQSTSRRAGLGCGRCGPRGNLAPRLRRSNRAG